MKFSAQIIEMGEQVEAEVDPADGDVLVLLKVKVEDARQLGPLLYSNLGLEVVMRTVDK